MQAVPLTELVRGTFEGLPALGTLEISYTDLVEIKKEAFNLYGTKRYPTGIYFSARALSPSPSPSPSPSLSLSLSGPDRAGYSTAPFSPRTCIYADSCAESIPTPMTFVRTATTTPAGTALKTLTFADNRKLEGFEDGFFQPSYNRDGEGPLSGVEKLKLLNLSSYDFVSEGFVSLTLHYDSSL